MRYSFKFFCFLSLFLVSSCNFNQLVINPYDKGNYSVITDKSVPILLRNKIKSVFKFNDEDNANVEARIYIKNYSFQEYSIYAGSALRSLEGEVTAKLQLESQTSQKTHNKDIKIVKRYKSNELNPFAEKEMIKMIEKNIYKEILDGIIREVSSFEM